MSSAGGSADSPVPPAPPYFHPNSRWAFLEVPVHAGSRKIQGAAPSPFKVTVSRTTPATSIALRDWARM